MSLATTINREPALQGWFKTRRWNRNQILVFEFLSRFMDYSKKLYLAEHVPTKLLNCRLHPGASQHFPWSMGLSDDKRVKFLLDPILTAIEIETLSRLFEKFEPREAEYFPIIQKLRKNKIPNLVQLIIAYRQAYQSNLENLDIVYSGEWQPFTPLAGTAFKIQSDVFHFHLPTNTQEFLRARDSLHTCIASFIHLVVQQTTFKFFLYKNDKLFASVEPYFKADGSIRGLMFGANNCSQFDEELQIRVDHLLNQVLMPYYGLWAKRKAK